MSTAALNDASADGIAAVRKISNIATLPEVTSRIIQTVEDPHSSAAELHNIVSHDPALVARILKVVNSAFYGLPGQIASVERAIVLLGLTAIKNIAVAASLGRLFRGVMLCEKFSARDLWTHCVSVGITARELARRLRVPLADEAFLAGMIHDVGMIVSLEIHQDKLRQVCDQATGDGEAFCDIEQRVMSVDHQQLGMALCELWRFPRSCQLVAGFHHRPTLLADNNRLLVTLVYVADTLCCAADNGFNLTAQHQRIEEAGLLDLHVDPSIVELVRANLPALLQESRELFA